MNTCLRSMLPRAACALTLAAAGAQAAPGQWTAASGLTPDQTGAFSLVAQGAVQATLAPGGPLVLESSNTRFDLLTYRASGSQLQMRDDLVVEFTTRFVDSVPLVQGSLRSPLMVNVSFGNHVGASLMITERAASFNYGHDQQVAPGAQLDWYSLNSHRLEFQGTTTAGTVTHYVNGELRYRMPLQQSNTLFSADPRIQFGDMTDYFGGTSEWLSFSHNAVPVPEPEALTLMLAGLAGLAGLARARRRRVGRGVLVAGLALAGFQAQAALHDRGSLSGVALVYDDVLNLTWLKDANWFSDWGAGISTDGQATFAQAKDALSSFYLRPDGLDVYRWRLPAFKPVNGVAIDLSFSYDGSTDFAYNIGAPGSAHPGTMVNEMAHLFHSTLGNKAYCDVAGQCPQAGYGLVNKGPFVNFPAFLDVNGPYWVELAGMPTPPGTAEAFRYNLAWGSQELVQTEDFRGYIWAVYDGDVTAVPEPAPSALLLAGLTVLWRLRRGSVRRSAP